MSPVPPEQNDSSKPARPVNDSRSRVDQYAHNMTQPGPDHLDELIKTTNQKRGSSHLIVGHLEGRLLKMLVALVKPRLVVEIGTFTGYSTLCMAEALPHDARLISCDIDARAHAIAHEALAETAYGKRVELRTGAASETLKTLDEVIDLAFIDADKRGYAEYYELILERMRPGGLIVLDNMLMRDGVFDPQTPQARAIDELNRFIAVDERVENVFLPVRDGIQLVRKR